MVWKVDDAAAICPGQSDADARWSCPLTNPAAGLNWSKSPDFRLFSVPGAQPTVEAPVLRGADLLAAYAPRNEDQLRYETRHRVDAHAAHPSVNWTLSAQTSLLDCAPLTPVECQLPAGKVIACLPEQNTTLRNDSPLAADQQTPVLAVIARPDASPQHSMLLLPHPADFHTAKIQFVTDVWRVQFDVFPAPLEKGVIRRAMFAAFWVPRAKDEALAEQLQRELAEIAPPLGA